MEKLGEGFIVVYPVFIVIGIPFKSDSTSSVILSVCTDFKVAKDFRNQVLENSTFFIDVRIDAYDPNTLNDYYL